MNPPRVSEERLSALTLGVGSDYDPPMPDSDEGQLVVNLARDLRDERAERRRLESELGRALELKRFILDTINRDDALDVMRLWRDRQMAQEPQP